MSRQYKIKNYSSKNNPFGRGPRRSPWKIILAVLAIAGLIFLGISIYPAVADYFSGKVSPSPLPPPVVTTPPPDSSPQPPVLGLSEEQPSPEPSNLLQVQGVVLPHETALDPAKLDTFLESLPPGTNTLYLEGKDNQGRLYFETSNPDALAWGAMVPTPAKLPTLVSRLQEKNLTLAIKFSVFSDPIAARGNIANAIMHNSGVIWIDNTLAAGGKPWLTPYAQGGRDYLLALAGELVEQGVGLLILEDLQFPRDPTGTGLFGETQGISRFDQLAQFLGEVQAVAKGTPVGLLLTQAQVASKADPGNLERFGGDPTNFTPDFFLYPTAAAQPLPPQLAGKKVLLLLPTTEGVAPDQPSIVAAP